MKLQWRIGGVVLLISGCIVCWQVRTMRTVPSSNAVLSPSSFAEYFWIDRYLKWHASHRLTATRKVVFRAHKSGVGDNYRRLIRAYVYAVQSERLFLIDWTQPYPISSILSDESVARFIYDPVNDAPNSTLGQGSVGFESTASRDVSHDDIVNRLKSPVHTVYVSINTGSYIAPYFRSLYQKKYNIDMPEFSEEVTRKLVRKILQFSLEMDRRQENANKLFGLCPVTEYSKSKCHSNERNGNADVRRPYIAVHARVGFGIGEGNLPRFSYRKGRETALATCLVRHVKKVAKNLEDSSPKVFLATDTPDFRPVFRNVMNQMMPTTEVHHFSHELRHVDNLWQNNTMSGKDIFLRTHAEMAVLGAGVHIVSFTSSFSRASFWRGSAKSYVRVGHKTCSALGKIKKM